LNVIINVTIFSKKPPSISGPATPHRPYPHFRFGTPKLPSS